MKIHIQGICGTFMSGIAILAKALGHEVSGSDKQAYPPMSTQLEAHGIEVKKGYIEAHLQDKYDAVVVGNVMSRGNPQVEYMLNNKLNFMSGPEWLYQHVLKDKTVIAVAGTHGKTTTSSMLAWILDYAGLAPGFLIGGIPNNFNVSVKLSQSKFFVIEADEYDTAFFDKRSKFLHYHPEILVLNNLEFDHADIFPNLDAIKTQFKHLLRTVPSQGKIIVNDTDLNLKAILQQENWTPRITFGSNQSMWQVADVSEDLSSFTVTYQTKRIGQVNWPFFTKHNIDNALAAIAAAHAIGVNPVTAIDALQHFAGVKRRMEFKGEINQVHVYEDFAHHPTAITSSLNGLRKKFKNHRLIALIELGSNTMQSGVHQEALPNSLNSADEIFLFANDYSAWDINALQEKVQRPIHCFSTIESLVDVLNTHLKPNDRLCLLSNTGFSSQAIRALQGFSDA